MFNTKKYDKISLYIPPRKSIGEVLGQLHHEYCIADNIKSDEIRHSVQDNINRIRDYLMPMEGTPKNGMIIFSGKDASSLSTDLRVILPNKPVTINLYRCDDHFDKDNIPK